MFPENVAGKETVAFLRFWCNLYLHWATLLAATNPFQRATKTLGENGTGPTVGIYVEHFGGSEILA